MYRQGMMAAFGVVLLVSPAAAGQIWQKPVVKECQLAPGGQCNVEVTCPASHPIAVSGGGGMPKSSPADNMVAMTMNLPIAKDKWRVRWKNMSSNEKASAKVAVKVLCASE